MIDNEKFRFDSEFFKKEYIEAYQNIKAMTHTTIASVIEYLTDFHSNGSYESIAKVFELLDEPNYAYMVRTTDLEKRDYITNVKYVSEDTYNFLSKSKVYGGEVIINKIGCPGKTFLMPNLGRPVSLGMNQFMLRTKMDAELDDVLVYVFLNSRIGQLLIKRKTNGTSPPSIDKEAVRSIYLPCFGDVLKKEIINKIEKSNSCFESAEQRYKEAEVLLTSEIGIDTEKIDAGAIRVKKLSDTYKQTDRLDAEYYQGKYDKLLYFLDNNETKLLGNIVDISKSIEPGSNSYTDEGIPFIRVRDVSATAIVESAIKLNKDLFNGLEQLYPKKDTILFSKDGTVGIAYKMTEDMEVITSGALLHLCVKNKQEVLPDYLALVLNSDIVKLQAERDTNGAIIQHWKVEDIKKVKIPMLPIDGQESIAKRIQDSFLLRKQAEDLLNLATTAVEVAIEEGEDAGLKVCGEADGITAG